jgi:SAM-dependent methyltransferase
MSNLGIEEKNAEQAVTLESLRENCLGSIKILSKRFSFSHKGPKIVRFINKKLYKFGIGGALNRYDSSLSLYSSRNDKKLYSSYSDDAIFCNFGSGAFQHPRWINFDFPGNTEFYKAIQGEPGIDFKPIDLCEENLQLPLESESVSLIYCAHVLEHLEEAKARSFLCECARILKSGGVMRIVVPSTDNDFFLSKIINSQDSIEDKVKLSSILSATSHTLSSTKTLDPETVAQDVITNDFSAADFFRVSVTERGISAAFDPSQPDHHIAHWNHQKFCNAAIEDGFKYYLPLYRGQTTASPFTNTEVFDTTETHVSLYGELIKA